MKIAPLAWLALIIFHIPLALVTVYLGQPEFVTVWLVTINILFSMFLMNLFDPFDLAPPNAGPGCLMIVVFIILTAIAVAVWSSALLADGLAQSGFIVIYMSVVSFGAYRLQRVPEIRLQKRAEDEKSGADEFVSRSADLKPRSSETPEIDFYRAAITDNSDKEIIKVAFHDALEAFSGTFPFYDGRNPDEFLFGSGIGDLFDLIPDELLNDPEMLFEFEQSLIATLAPHIPLLGNDHWGYTEDFGNLLEEEGLDDFPSLDSLASLKWYLDEIHERTVSQLDYDDSSFVSHPIPDRLLNAVSNAREEIDALAAEKESQRLRKILVDELSNIRNSKTADEVKD
jgi:hypothetical protein